LKVIGLRMLVGLAVLLVGAMAVLGKAGAQTSGETWQVEIDIFSGRPNPVFTLSASEVADVKGRLATAKSAAGASANVKTIRPSILGYRGLLILGKSSDGKQVTGDIEVYKGKLLRRTPSPAAVLDDSAAGVERQLLSLAVAKNAVSPQLMQEIQKALP
jgi:hypothetical protein